MISFDLMCKPYLTQEPISILIKDFKQGMLENGQMVAVKELVQTTPSSQEQFENELNLLMNLKHQNIVRLLGYCYEMQHSHMPHQGKLVSFGMLNLCFAWNV